MFGQGQPVSIAPVLQPASWLCLDLETRDSDEAGIQEAIAAWKPPGNVKDPDKIEAKREEAAAKIREKAALLDASPVICCAIETDRERVIFSGMPNRSVKINGWEIMEGDDEKGMLILLRDWLDRNTSAGETEIVGHNIRGFDLPKLRQAYIRHRLKLPSILQPGEDSARLFDTMHRIKSFSMELRDERFISLDQVARVLDIPRPKSVIDGSEVPKLYANGHHATILTYCAIDCATTSMAYRLMSGIAPELE